MQASRWVHASPAFIGFDVADARRSGRSECFRAIEESAAYVAARSPAGSSRRSPRRGRRGRAHRRRGQGPLWPQILADALGVPVRIPVVKESTALGAAIYAGVGAGLYADASTRGRARALRAHVRARARAAAAYDELYDHWLELYRGALELSEAGLVRPLWRAAGT